MTDQAPSLADDLLEGADAIAEYLGTKWSAKRVYMAKHRQTLPVRRRTGLGLYAFKSELNAFLRAPESMLSEQPGAPA